MKKSAISERIAMIIRVVAIPPVMATVLIVLLWLNGHVFTTARDLAWAFVFLVIIPVLAYPVSYGIPRFRKGGRLMQRKLAFVFGGVAYTAAAVYGIAFNRSREVKCIYLIYLFSIVILTVFNSFSKVRASGHACSVITPVIVSAYYYGLIGGVMGISVYLAVLWCSVRTGRHTVAEFILGSLCCILAAGISILFVYVLRLI